MGMEITQDLFTHKNSNNASESTLQNQELSERQNIEMHRKITEELRRYRRRNQ